MAKTLTIRQRMWQPKPYMGRMVTVRDTNGRLWRLPACAILRNMIRSSFSKYDVDIVRWPEDWTEMGSELGVGDCIEVKDEGGKWWASNSVDLFGATGIDLRSQHATYGLVAMEAELRDGAREFRRIVYHDDQPVIGRFDRIQRFAAEYAARHLVDAYYYFESWGGQSGGRECSVIVI